MSTSEMNSTFIGTNANPTTEVQWNIIVYSLIPIAMSTMTQPVGSVLGSEAVSQTWLRSSPFFCIFDTIVFILQVLRLRLPIVGLNLELKDALRIPLEDRFRHFDKPSEAINGLKASSVIRCLFFILGTHGNIFKLASATNVPWSKTWGLMFLASFIVFEVAILCYSKELPCLDTNEAIESRYSLQPEIYQRFLIVGRALACASHFCLLGYAFMTLHKRPSSTECPEFYYISAHMAIELSVLNGNSGDAWFQYYTVSVIIFVQAFSTLMVLFPDAPHYFGNKPIRGERSRVRPSIITKILRPDPFAAILPAALTYPCFMLPFLMISGIESLPILMEARLPLIPHLCTLGATLVYLAVYYLLYWWPSAGEYLLITDPAARHDLDRQRSGGVGGRRLTITAHTLRIRALPPTMFIVSLIMCYLWYEMVYEPEGTTLPSWTTKF